MSTLRVAVSLIVGLYCLASSSAQAWDRPLPLKWNGKVTCDDGLVGRYNQKSADRTISISKDNVITISNGTVYIKVKGFPRLGPIVPDTGNTYAIAAAAAPPDKKRRVFFSGGFGVPGGAVLFEGYYTLNKRRTGVTKVKATMHGVGFIDPVKSCWNKTTYTASR